MIRTWTLYAVAALAVFNLPMHAVLKQETFIGNIKHHAVQVQTGVNGLVSTVHHGTQAAAGAVKAQLDAKALKYTPEIRTAVKNLRIPADQLTWQQKKYDLLGVWLPMALGCDAALKDGMSKSSKDSTLKTNVICLTSGFLLGIITQLFYAKFAKDAVVNTKYAYLHQYKTLLISTTLGYGITRLAIGAGKLVKAQLQKSKQIEEKNS